MYMEHCPRYTLYVHVCACIICNLTNLCGVLVQLRCRCTCLSFSSSVYQMPYVAWFSERRCGWAEATRSGRPPHFIDIGVVSPASTESHELSGFFYTAMLADDIMQSGAYRDVVQTIEFSSLFIKRARFDNLKLHLMLHGRPPSRAPPRVYHRNRRRSRSPRCVSGCVMCRRSS